MRIFKSLAVAALLLAAPAAALADRLPPEAELAKVLEGRVAGEPVNCISLARIQNVRIIDRTALVYEAGRTVYVNRPRDGARWLDDWSMLVTKPTGSQLCSLDMVRLHDRSGGFQRGFVHLGEFVPYKRVKNAARR
jgi:hypothetical protein